jgi:hypothetical protein
MRHRPEFCAFDVLASGREEWKDDKINEAIDVIPRFGEGRAGSSPQIK